MTNRITHEAALLGLAAGIRKAKELNQRSTLSIVDDGGHLIASVRLDDAAFGTIEIAHNKAYTAAAFRQSTAAWMEVVQPGAALYGLERSCARPFVVFGGGIPIVDGNSVVGGVGVSGGPVEADEAIANSIVSAIQQQ
ncbi:hypothetical protein D3C87_1666880 [compost metagenome]